jgi:hypothetical protein
MTEDGRTRADECFGYAAIVTLVVADDIWEVAGLGYNTNRFL